MARAVETVASEPYTPSTPRESINFEVHYIFSLRATVEVAMCSLVQFDDGV